VFNNVRGCTSCDRLAMLDPVTGVANTAFGPQPNAAVLKLALAGNTVFAGGTFATVDGRRRTRLAAVNATTGAVGGHLTNLCTVRNTSYTLRRPGAVTVRAHVAALDPPPASPSPGTPAPAAPAASSPPKPSPPASPSAATSRAPAAPPTAASRCSPGSRDRSVTTTRPSILLLPRSLVGLDPVDPEALVDAEPAVEQPVAG
jgi:hypothetical protein